MYKVIRNGYKIEWQPANIELAQQIVQDKLNISPSEYSDDNPLTFADEQEYNLIRKEYFNLLHPTEEEIQEKTELEQQKEILNVLGQELVDIKLQLIGGM